MVQKVDKIFKNGKIYTLREDKEVKEAICIKDGRIVFIGSTSEACESFQADEVIDLEGSVMLPGMGDSHLHFFAYCQVLTTVDLAGVTTQRDAMEKIRKKAAETPEGQWIKATNFDQSKWTDVEDVLPTKDILDKVSTKHPIVMKRVCLHTSIANSKAIEIAGVGKDYDFGSGGKVELDDKGYPNGIFREQATKIFDDIMPDPAKEPETKKRIMEEAFNDVRRLGITTLHTYAAEIWKYNEDIDDYLELARKGELPARITIYLDRMFDKPFLTKKEMEDPYRLVQMGGLKIFCDGSLGSRSAKLYDPYEDDPTTDGLLVQTQEELNKKVLEGYKKVGQTAIHAIGDKALDDVLTAIEYALSETRKEGMTEREQKNKLPFRIIHAQMAGEDLVKRMAKLPIILDIQPTFLMTDSKWLEQRVGKKRAADSYRWKYYLDNKLVLLGGSDSPVESFSPWIGIYAAVTRKDMDGLPEGGYQPEEKVSVYDAACMYSKNLAYATGQEDYLGTIEVGKFADLIIIDRDIFTIPEDDILNVQVQKTYLAGKEVYSV